MNTSTKTHYSTLSLYWLSTAKRLTDAQAIVALREYRSTGGMSDVVFAEPNPDDLSAERCEALAAAGPSVDDIDWTGFTDAVAVALCERVLLVLGEQPWGTDELRVIVDQAIRDDVTDPREIAHIVIESREEADA